MLDFFEVYASRIDRRGEDECWEWMGARITAGYGNIQRRPRSIYAHRAAYEATHGEGSAVGLIVRHRCDNPPCCNPHHLVGGTHLDNVHDMIERGRGRWVRGEESPVSKLTETVVLEMRRVAATGVPITDIAKDHPQFAYMTVNAAVRGISWAHLPGAVLNKNRRRA